VQEKYGGKSGSHYHWTRENVGELLEERLRSMVCLLRLHLHKHRRIIIAVQKMIENTTIMINGNCQLLLVLPSVIFPS